jgi:catechol 2,3-dioxygenase-like lactoylglutathione lyase family enzyme
VTGLSAAALVAFVGVSDLDRAQEFYGGVLGLALVDERPYALVATVGGTPLRITLVPAVARTPYTVLGWNVPDLTALATALSGRGLTLVRVDGLDQDADGVWAAPGGARVAWFNDPDGNLLSLTEPPRAAR